MDEATLVAPEALAASPDNAALRVVGSRGLHGAGDAWAAEYVGPLTRADCRRPITHGSRTCCSAAGCLRERSPSPMCLNLSSSSCFDAIIVIDELGYEGAARAPSLACLGFCTYTWFALKLFQRMLARQLGTLRLDLDF